jgi:hypothetical protein
VRDRGEFAARRDTILAEAPLEQRADRGDQRRTAGQEDAVDRFGRRSRAGQRLVHRGFDAAQIVRDPLLEIGTAHIGTNLDPAAREVEFGMLAARQRALEAAHGVIEREALLMLDQCDHAADQFGALGVALQAADLVERPAVAHHREPRPIAEIGEIAAGNLQYLVERPVMTALAEQRQHEPVDDAIVETVARDPDPRRGERDAAARASGRRNADDRKVGRPAAEVGDEDRRGLGQPRGIAVRRAQRFVDIIDFGAERREHRIVSPAREFGVGPRAGIFDRTADDDAARPLVERAAGMRDEALEEQATHILEAERLVEDHRALEQRARGDALERLDKAAVERRLEIFVDRPRPRLVRDPVPAALLFPETERRAEHRIACVAERDKPRFARAIGQRHNAVRRAEIEAERARGRLVHDTLL